MEDEKSFLHTLILGVCIIISAILIVRMAFYKPVPYFEPHKVPEQTDSGQTTLQIQFTDEDLSAIVRDAGSEQNPLRELQVSIGEDCQLSLSGILSKEKLQTMLASSESSDLFSTALAIMPQECAFSAEFAITQANGTPQLEIISAKLGGVELPQSAVELVAGKVNQSWQLFLAEQGIEESSFRSEEGILYVENKKTTDSEKTFSESVALFMY